MEDLKPCLQCACYCWLVSEPCIIANSEIPKAGIIKTNHINDARNDLDDLIGTKCSDELCEAISAAIKSSEDSGEDDTLFDFLPAKWKDLITNRHFKKWYSERVAFHWFEGSSITELRKAGLVTTSADDTTYKNDYRHAEEKQRKRLAEVADQKSGEAEFKFRKDFWTPNLSNYDCAPESCECSHEEKSSIGLVVLNENTNRASRYYDKSSKKNYPYNRKY